MNGIAVLKRSRCFAWDYMAVFERVKKQNQHVPKLVSA